MTKGHARSFVALWVGGVNIKEKPWSATINVIEMEEGKTAAHQVKKVEEVWEDIHQWQKRLGVKETTLYDL
jgi:hypothetical protein